MGITWAFETAARLVVAAARGRGIPFQATLFVTNRCNKACVYCSIPNLTVPELRTEEWHEILDRLRGAGTRRVLFFGGEPLLREDILELVTHARRIGLRVGMTTNGSLVPRRVDVIRQLHSLAVSLDGSPATQERTRGRGSHEEALRAVEIARKWSVPVKIAAVLCADTSGDIPWLLDLGERHRLPVVLNLMRFEETGLHRNAARHRLDDESVRQMLGTIAGATRKHPQIVFSSYTYETARNWPDYSLDRLTRGHDLKAAGPRCSAGRFHCAVSADGLLYPCPPTMGLVPALSVLRDGLEAALKQAGAHDCVACASPCMIETNATFAFHPRVLLNHISALWNRRIY